MKNNSIFKALFAALLLVQGFFSYGQETSTTLKDVTVTSSMIPTDVSKTGRNIITIKGEEFAKLPVNSIDELLRYVPGVEVQSRGPMGSQSDFVLRGGTFQQVLVILDGMRVNDPNSGHFTSYIPITPAQIERIEILKGASSAVYGSDAVGGVINIITKSFSKQSSKKEVTGQLTTGAYGLLNFNTGGFYTNGKTSVDGGLITNNATGQQQRGTKGFFHNTTGSASVTHEFKNAWQIGARSTYDSRKFAAQNFYTTALSDTAQEHVTTSWNQLRLSHKSDYDNFNIQSAYKSVTDTYQFNPASTANHSTSVLFQTLATYERKISDRTTLLGGLQFQDRKIKSNDRGDHSIQQEAAFVILQQSVRKNLSVSPAIRLDHDGRSGTELVPQLNISYATGNLQLRGSAGKTIRQADFTERYNNYNQVLVPSGSRVGNPDLLAERSFSYEAGLDYWLMENTIKLSGSLFQQKFSKLIDYVNTPYAEMPRQQNLSATGTYALAKNVSDVTTSGAEADLFYRKQYSGGWSVFSSAGLLWLNSTSPGGVPSLYLSNHAKFLTNFTAGVSSRRFSLSVTGVYKVRTAQESTSLTANLSREYFLINMKGEVFIVPQKLSGFIQVDNLTNTSYSDLLGAKMPSRWNMVGIKFRI